MHQQKITPFNTGKLLIGVHHQRDMRPQLTASEEAIQDALLSKRERRHIYSMAAAIATAALCSCVFVMVFYMVATVFKQIKG